MFIWELTQTIHVSITFKWFWNTLATSTLIFTAQALCTRCCYGATGLIWVILTIILAIWFKLVYWFELPKYFISFVSYLQSWYLPHRHVFKTHLPLLHLNSFGSQRSYKLQLDSSDPSLQSGLPLQSALFGIQSPFMHVASCGEQAVGGRSYVWWPDCKENVIYYLVFMNHIY